MMRNTVRFPPKTCYTISTVILEKYVISSQNLSRGCGPMLFRPPRPSAYLGPGLKGQRFGEPGLRERLRPVPPSAAGRVQALNQDWRVEQPIWTDTTCTHFCRKTCKMYCYMENYPRIILLMLNYKREPQSHTYVEKQKHRRDLESSFKPVTVVSLELSL